MKILDVPYTNLSDIKKSPRMVFDTARETDSGVYVFKNSKPLGVVLTTEQYEGLNDEIEKLYDKIDELTVKERIINEDEKTYSVEDATGVKLEDVEFDENDGWE